MALNNSKSLLLLCNTQCDIACRYCFYTTGHEKRDSRKLSAHTAVSFAEKLLALGFSNVVLTGGDPLSRKYRSTALEVTKIFQEAGLTVIINSSGSHITDEDCDRIVEVNPFRVDVSVDSHLEEVHNGLRGRYADAIFLIKGLLARGYRSVVTTTVVSGKNADTAADTIKFLRSLGVQDARVQPVFLPGQDTAELKALELRLNERFFAELSDLYSSDSSRSFYPNYLKWWRQFYGDGQNAVVERPTCQMGKRTFVCDASGNISACFHRSDVQLGNLMQDSLEDIQHKLNSHVLINDNLPGCVGKHCVSLFDHAGSWKTT